MSLLCLQVIDWVLGPGERYLSTSKDIGDSVITCEILRKEHEEFEHNARVRQVLLTSCILGGVYMIIARVSLRGEMKSSTVFT